MYLYNSSKNILDLPSGETLYPGCLSAYISHLGNAAVQPLIRSGMVTVLQTQNIFDVVGYRIPLCYRGPITNSNEFPSMLLVRDGMVLTIAADVSDINPEKTNTGKSFVQGQTIIWNNGDWWELPECIIVPDYYHWTATYSCSTFTWTVVLSGVDKTGPESEWVCDGLSCTMTTLTADPPADPVYVPVCPEVAYSVSFPDLSPTGRDWGDPAPPGASGGYCGWVIPAHYQYPKPYVLSKVFEGQWEFIGEPYAWGSINVTLVQDIGMNQWVFTAERTGGCCAIHGVVIPGASPVGTHVIDFLQDCVAPPTEQITITIS